MTQKELNYIKDSFSQIIDDIGGNPDWYDAAKAVASDLGTIEKQLEELFTKPSSNMDEAAPDESINPFDTKLFQDGVKEGLRLAKESGGEPTGPELNITPLTTLGEVKSFVAAAVLNKKTKKIIILEDNE